MEEEQASKPQAETNPPPFNYYAVFQTDIDLDELSAAQSSSSKKSSVSKCEKLNGSKLTSKTVRLSSFYQHDIYTHKIDEERLDEERESTAKSDEYFKANRKAYERNILQPSFHLFVTEPHTATVQQKQPMRDELYYEELRSSAVEEAALNDIRAYGLVFESHAIAPELVGFEVESYYYLNPLFLEKHSLTEVPVRPLAEPQNNSSVAVECCICFSKRIVNISWRLDLQESLPQWMRPFILQIMHNQMDRDEQSVPALQEKLS